MPVLTQNNFFERIFIFNMNAKPTNRFFYFINRFWNNISFRKKTILYTSILLYIFILLFGLLIYNRAVHSMHEITESNTKQRLKSLDVEIKSKLSSYSTITSNLLLNLSFQEMLEECPGTFIESFEYDNELSEHLDSICQNSTVSADWELYFTYDRPTSTHSNIFSIEDAKDSAWYIRHNSQSRNTIIWSLESASSNGPHNLICTLGIRNRNTQTIPAYMKMNINLARIISPIREATKDINGIFLLYALDGTLLWCSENSDLDYSEYTLLYKNPSALEPITVSGNLGERTVTFLDGQKYGYQLFCVQNAATFMSNYMNFGQYFLVILSLIIILSLCILIFTAKLVDGRIIDLTADIQAMDEGDLNYQADTNLDEVGELSRAFSELIERIRTLIAQEREFEEALFEQEIQALQAQINPHFLFNTLSVINVLAREIEADNISEALEALANFYHFSLNDDKKITTIRDELTMLDSYLTICSIRYRNQLKIKKEIDPQSLDYLIPKLIIQPFCENAVFHGFVSNPEKEPEINISIKLENTCILVTVSDNGEGMSPAELKQATETGFAITNVHKRIQMLYGEQYGVSISSVQGIGTTVIIKLGLSIR